MVTGKKGITPTIAVVILLVLTVSSAGTAFYWLHLVNGQIEAEDEINVKEYGGLEGAVEVLASRYDAQFDNLVIFLKNTNGVPVPIETSPKVPTTLWVLKDAQQSVLCSTDWSGVENGPVCKEGCLNVMAAGELRRIVLGNFGSNSLCDVSEQPPESLLSYMIDFSGEATAAGGFVR